MTIELISSELTDTNIRILKEASCMSLSGSTTLKYQIGCNDQNEILFKIKESSGTDVFNKGWHFTADMFDFIYVADKPFSWKVLYPRCRGFESSRSDHI